MRWPSSMPAGIAISSARSSRHPPVAAAHGAGRGNDAALTRAAGAGHDVHHLAEDRLRDATLLAGAVAFRAGLGLGAGLAAGALAVSARHLRRELDRLGDAEHRLGELDGQVVAQVRAGHHPPAPARAGRRPTEERVEDVAERAEAAAESLEAAGRGAIDAGVPEHVVCAAALPIGQDAVGLVQLLEALLGAVVAIDVGVVLLRQAPEGALDLGLVRVAGDTEHVVVVALHRHGVADHTNWHSATASAKPVDISIRAFHREFLPAFVRNHRLRSAG